MSKIQTLNHTTLKVLREEINNALKPIMDKYGLSSLSAGSASYSSNEFNFKVEGVLSAEKAEEKNNAISAQYATMLGLPEDIVGKTFKVKGKTMKVTRIDPGKSKNCVIATCLEDGKNYKMPPETATNALRRV